MEVAASRGRQQGRGGSSEAVAAYLPVLFWYLAPPFAKRESARRLSPTPVRTFSTGRTAFWIAHLIVLRTMNAILCVTPFAMGSVGVCAPLATHVTEDAAAAGAVHRE